MRTVMMVVAGMMVPGLAWADLPVVQGQSLAKRAESDAWVDRTFTLQDRFAQRVSSLTPGQESLGCNKDEHLGVWLSDPSLPVVLRRTATNERLLNALEHGCCVSRTGVAPSTLTEPSACWRMLESCTSCSSVIWPTISSRMSSSVMRPCTSPYSSTTSAICDLRFRNALS